jgi:hypothetical protein
LDSILQREFSQNFPHSNYFENKPTVNIKFISGTIPFNNGIHINPAYWVLKSWYKHHGKNNNKVNWLDAIHINVDLCENEITRIIENEKPDIMCFGLYIWNYNLYSRLGRFIKNKYPHIILLGGGPEIYAHKELELFWKEHEWLDAVAYGDGEEAFTVMIDTMINSNTVDSAATNISYMTDNKPVIEPYKRFKDAEFNTLSPYLDNLDEVHFAVNQIKNKNDKLTIIMNWEFTKGCPYSCAFCDWSSGLHHKVTRKEYDWKLDLNLFNELNLHVRWVDANIGLFKEDIEVVKYSCELEKNNPNFKLTFNNLAKLNKQRVFEIIDYVESVDPGNRLFTMTVQDIDQDVLSNINRPDIPWSEYKDYIVKTKQKHPKFQFDIETMLGMPGQKLENYAQNLIEFAELSPRAILSHIWCMLINSPGYNKEYQKKYDLRVVPALHITGLPYDVKTRDDVLTYLDDCEYYSANTVVGTNTATLGDILAMHSMVMLYNNLIFHMKKIDMKVITKIYLNFNYWKEFGEKISQPLEKDLLNYNKMLLLHDNYGTPITFAQHFGSKDTIRQIIKQLY